MSNQSTYFFIFTLKLNFLKGNQFGMSTGCESNGSKADKKVYQQETQIIKKIDLNGVLPSVALQSTPSRVNAAPSSSLRLNYFGNNLTNF